MIAQLNRSFLHDNSIIHRIHHTHCAYKVTAFFLFQQIIVVKKISILYTITKYMFNNIFLDNHASKSHIYKIKLLNYDLWIY